MFLIGIRVSLPATRIIKQDDNIILQFLSVFFRYFNFVSAYTYKYF